MSCVIIKRPFQLIKSVVISVFNFSVYALASIPAVLPVAGIRLQHLNSVFEEET